MGQAAGIGVEGLREFARRAAKLDDGAVLAALRDTFTATEQFALARMQARAAATGRRQDVVAAATMTGSRARDRAVIRSRSSGKSEVQDWVAGAAFGAHHDRTRTGPKRGEYMGWNQFALPRSKSSWFLGGGYDAAEKMRPQIEAALDRILSTLT